VRLTTKDRTELVRLLREYHDTQYISSLSVYSDPFIPDDEYRVSRYADYNDGQTWIADLSRCAPAGEIKWTFGSICYTFTLKEMETMVGTQLTMHPFEEVVSQEQYAKDRWDVQGDDSEDDSEDDDNYLPDFYQFTHTLTFVTPTL